MLRLITERRLAASAPVMTCGYTNSASAEPSASVAKSNCVEPVFLVVGMNVPFGFLVAGLMAFMRLRDAEDVAPAAKPGRDVEDRHEDEYVDQRVLHERDRRRGAQPRHERVDGQHDEGDEQRQVLHVRVGAGWAHAHDRQDRLDADQLKGDVGHGGQDPGGGDGQGQAARAVAAADEVGGRDVAVHPGDRPEPGQEDEGDQVGHDRVERPRRSRSRASCTPSAGTAMNV